MLPAVRSGRLRCRGRWCLTRLILVLADGRRRLHGEQVVIEQAVQQEIVVVADQAVVHLDQPGSARTVANELGMARAEPRSQVVQCPPDVVDARLPSSQ